MRYRKTFLEEYETLAGTDPISPFGGDFREDAGQFVINYIAEHGKLHQIKILVENKCDTCQGEGEVFQESGAGRHATANLGWIDCPDCDGNGFWIEDGNGSD